MTEGTSYDLLFLAVDLAKHAFQLSKKAAEMSDACTPTKGDYEVAKQACDLAKGSSELAKAASELCNAATRLRHPEYGPQTMSSRQRASSDKIDMTSNLGVFTAVLGICIVIALLNRILWS
jgi:hypothetical protein